MVLEREVTVEGTGYTVVISDEREALLAAKAAGRASVGLLGSAGGQGLWEAEYAVESPEAADSAYLERVVRRKYHLPWVIAESERIRIREFTAGDADRIPVESSGPDGAVGAGYAPDWVLGPDGAAGRISGSPSGVTWNADAVFYTSEKLSAYIRNQYRFYGYGIWAVVRKSDDKIIGKAGISGCDICKWERMPENLIPEKEAQDMPEDGTQLELGYHIFRQYRRKGYAEEACRLILRYVSREYHCPVYAATGRENTASVRLLEKLGFQPVCMGAAGPGATAEKYSGPMPPPPVCVYCWR